MMRLDAKHRDEILGERGEGIKLGTTWVWIAFGVVMGAALTILGAVIVS